MPSEKRERQRERRQKRQTKEKRRQQLATARRRGVTVLTIVVISIAALLIFQALGQESDPAEEATGQPVACGAQRPDPPTPMSFEEPEDMQIPPDATVTATLITSCGEIVVELDHNLYPETANSFVFLAGEGFYNGTTFHRIIETFMVQGGDPTATGTGGPGYVIPDEHPPDGFVFSEGTMAMANTGRPNTTGSQFFIVSGDDATGLVTFNVLGRVMSGLETLGEIAAVPVGPSPGGEISKPRETVYVEEIRIDITS